MLRVDFHTHSADDPADYIPHTSTEIIDRAAALGFGALAITLHDKQLNSRGLEAYAAARHIVLIPGVERTIQGRHVLLLNFSMAAQVIDSFEALALLRAQEPQGLVVAPHPFYPHPSALRSSLMDSHADLFDAVELNSFYTATFDPNRAAIKWARAHGKPIVANSDAHRLSLLGTSFSMVDAEANMDAICQAVKAGRVQVRRRPLSVVEAVTYLVKLVHRGSRPSRVRHHGTVTA